MELSPDKSHYSISTRRFFFFHKPKSCVSTWSFPQSVGFLWQLMARCLSKHCPCPHDCLLLDLACGLLFIQLWITNPGLWLSSMSEGRLHLFFCLAFAGKAVGVFIESFILEFTGLLVDRPASQHHSVLDMESFPTTVVLLAQAIFYWVSNSRTPHPNLNQVLS